MFGMLMASIRTLFHRPAAARPASEAEPVARPDDSPIARPGPAPARSVEALRRDLRVEVTTRAEILLAGLPRSLQTTDAPALLRSLVDDMDIVIRQPPLAARHALSVARDPHATTADLAALFEPDPGLTGALLQRANAAPDAPGRAPCATAAQAVERIGAAGVENLLLEHTFHTALGRTDGAYEQVVDMVWRHMVRTGPVAAACAPAFGVDSGRAHAAGLFHDAGKLVIVGRITSLRSAWQRDIRMPHHMLLWALRRLHEPIGALAAIAWGLGADVAGAIAVHHRQPPPATPDPLSEVCYLAERIDLARARGLALDWNAIWSEGALPGTPERIARRFGDDTLGTLAA